MGYNRASAQNNFDKRTKQLVSQMLPPVVLSQTDGISPNVLTTDSTFDNGDGTTSVIAFYDLDSYDNTHAVYR